MILIFLLFCYQTYQINCLKKEHFDSASDIKDAVKADIEAIRNLSSIASSLSSGNALTLPANITIPGTLNTKGAVTFDGTLNTSGSKFKVDADGNITCRSIRIGKWTIWNRTHDNGLGFSCGTDSFTEKDLDAEPLKYFAWPHAPYFWSRGNGTNYLDEIKTIKDTYIKHGDKFGFTNWGGHRRRFYIDNDAWSGGNRNGGFNFADVSVTEPSQFGGWESMRMVKL